MSFLASGGTEQLEPEMLHGEKTYFLGIFSDVKRADICGNVRCIYDVFMYYREPYLRSFTYALSTSQRTTDLP